MAHWADEIGIDPVVWATALFGVATAALLVTAVSERRPPARAAFAIFVDCATKARPIPGFSAILPPGMVPHESAS